MNKMRMIFAAALAVGAAGALSATSARADEIELAHIDTNNCERAASEIRLLNGRRAHVTAECERGEFIGRNGALYRYRVHTHVETRRRIHRGDVIRLARIDTNDCAAAQSEIRLLDSRDVAVETYCEYGTFRGSNGRLYDSRLVTTLYVND